jgi:hypothetical protein
VRSCSKHHPHRFGLDEVVDLLRTFTLWSARTRSHAFNAAVHAERDAVAPYATLLWNCMPKVRTQLRLDDDHFGPQPWGPLWADRRTAAHRPRRRALVSRTATRRWY